MSNSKGRFSRIRQLDDVATNPNRYRNEDDADLDEYDSQEDWRDQTKPSWGERLQSRKLTF